MRNTISTTFILPAYNESNSILKSLRSLVDQELDDILMKIIVVSNGCTDDTEEKAKTFAKISKFKIDVISTNRRQKGNAINLGRTHTTDNIVLYGDADCFFEKTAVTKIVRDLTDTDQYAVVGGLDTPNFERSKQDSLLYQFQKIMQIERLARGRVLTIGRLIGFNQSKIPEPFPDNVHSEDIWLALTSAGKYGFESIKVNLEAKVHYQPPLSWSDFLAQETRYEMSMDQLFDKFPDLKTTYENRRRPLPIEQRQRTEKSILQEIQDCGISSSVREQLHNIFDRIVEENAKCYLDKFTKDNGMWSPVPTTK
jgi:glycosyltransferase involved in cell wall biosynthesis